MIATIESCTLVGLKPHPVLCEVDLAPQLPAFSLVGLPSSLTQESRERIRAAVVNAGFEWPARKVTINLLPAHLPKWGSHFELAMALGVLNAGSEENFSIPVFALGELSLSGNIRPCLWTAAIAHWLLEKTQVAYEQGNTIFVIAHPEDIKSLVTMEPKLQETCDLTSADDLRLAHLHLKEAMKRKLATSQNPIQELPLKNLSATEQMKAISNFETLRNVQGEPLGIVGALVAIAGDHHCLFAGPHGMGKSMIIRGICEGSKPLTVEQVQLRKALLSPFGESYANEFFEDEVVEFLIKSNSEKSIKTFTKPVVSLQSSISRAGLEGALLGSGQTIPGELTRAHLGIVVADEFLEFRRDVIEAFRQPLEEAVVRLQRAKLRVILPAKFQFLASTNLCPCGFLGSTRQECRCFKLKRNAYQIKLSGPILDRFDLVIAIGQDKSQPIPKYLMPIVEELLDINSWQLRLVRFDEKKEQASIAQNAAKSVIDNSLVPFFRSGLSHRGKVKLIQLATTIAGLLDEDLSPQHFEFANHLRQDLEPLFKSNTPENMLRTQIYLSNKYNDLNKNKVNLNHNS